MMNLRAVDAIEIFSLVDNSIEVIYHLDRDDVKRPNQWFESDAQTLPLADHGFAVLVRTYAGGDVHTVLLDTGPRPDILVENARRMALDLQAVEAIVISHSHWDHHGGLLSVLDAIEKPDVSVLIHANMFGVFGVRKKDGAIEVEARAPFPTEADIRARGGVPVDSAAPVLIAGGTLLVTGEIPRLADYETGFPGRFIRADDGGWQPYDMCDERALAANVAGCGLVVLTGCGHRGIVSTARRARALTGVDRVHMMMGGFHLAGEKVEPRIPQTVADVAALAPGLLVPCHCTGFPAMMAFAQAMPGAFVANSVGNRYTVGAPRREK
ncbi:MAG: MBL fold metallo-hydrolase [Anaerolineae bacterium]|nr:MBL fold metallo-hydrolase [Anaerolineae bacterium]